MLVRVNSWCGSLPNDIQFAFLAYFHPNQNKSNTSMVNSNVECIEGKMPRHSLTQIFLIHA